MNNVGKEGSWHLQAIGHGKVGVGCFDKYILELMLNTT
jgi:hypothetical protein